MLPLLAISYDKSANRPDTFDNRNGHYLVKIKNTNESMVKPTYYPSTLFKLIHAQKNDIFCRTATAQVGRAKNEFNITSNGLLVQWSVVYGVIQIVIPPSLLQRTRMASYHPRIAEKLGNRCIADTLRQSFYWPNMAADVEHIVSTFPSIASNNPQAPPLA